MENWSWKQIIGLTLLTVGGACGFVAGLALLASMFSAKYSFAILIAMMLLIGAILWFFGKKKGGEE